jgi:hypothetical protein
MTADEVQAIADGEVPVMCRDNAMGLMTVFPVFGQKMCGVQVHGEMEHRWIAPADLRATANGAFVERGAMLPESHQSWMNFKAILRESFKQKDLAQLFVFEDWLRRGGERLEEFRAEPPRPGRIVRCEPGQPWPDPPHGGRWSRDPKTGDLIEQL